MKDEKLTKVLSYVVVALLSAILTAGILLGVFMWNNGRQSKLATLENLILQCFIGQADQTAIEDAAANAMVKALGDRWSYYIPADQYGAHTDRENNNYVGIGVSISEQEDGSIAIDQVDAGGPAEKAGMQAGDVIVRVNGQSILGMDPQESKKLLQGEENTTAAITVLRGEEEVTLTVTRLRLDTPVAVGQMLTEEIGMVTIHNFNNKCAAETVSAIEELLAQGAQKLIFDVRNNPGGFASEMVEVLDYLLPEGKLFTSVYYSGKEITEMSDARCLNIPMAVLINGRSYSAAEFFAAAMAEYEAAVIVGQKTVGKGYFQSTFQLPDGSAVNLSIGKYYTPQGKNLADVGITPDIAVAPAAGNVTAPMEDPQIAAAVEALRTK